MNTNTASPAYRFVQMMWDQHDGGQHGRSWTRLNQSMAGALRLAIEGGLRFNEADFSQINADFDGYRWIGEDYGEYMYTIACSARHSRSVPNLSAARAYEHWRGRKPFLWQKKRLAVGSQFSWDGASVVVTSFNDKQDELIACAYHAYPNNHKVAKRFRITRKQFQAAQRQVKAGNESPKEGCERKIRCK